LHAAPLSGKRLLALWNALPGAEKRRKVGDREALIPSRRRQSRRHSLSPVPMQMPTRIYGLTGSTAT
jgi:hypothetical protein